MPSKPTKSKKKCVSGNHAQCKSPSCPLYPDEDIKSMTPKKKKQYKVEENAKLKIAEYIGSFKGIQEVNFQGEKWILVKKQNIIDILRNIQSSI